MTPGVRPLVAGNWKMNGDRNSLQEIASIASGSSDRGQNIDMLICPPATMLSAAAEMVADAPLAIGAQDCHSAASGAHTGDLSASMLRDAGATHIIVGHSERRTDHGESNELVRAKAEAVHGENLIAIVCIGETNEEREAGKTLDVLGVQLTGSVADNATAQNTVIAYEPVWAIGTGLTPTVEDIQQAHGFLRGELESRFGADGATMRLLYGGSVKPGNSAELMAISNVDGALVGGASLKASDFLAICDAYN